MIFYKIGQSVPLDYPRTIVGKKLPRPLWFALQVAPQREHVAEAALRSKGVHACYPKVERTWKVRGKHVKRAFPVVSQIVYAKFEHQPHWDVLKYRRIITGVIAWGGVPIIIPGDTIRQVMGLPTEAERLEQARRELLRAREGEQATITEGPFAGSTVDVREIKGGVAWFCTLTGIKGSAELEKLKRKT